MSTPARSTQDTDQFGNNEVSGVSWGAVMAGAAAAAALSVVFLILGVGLGFSAVSPWQNHGISAEALGVSAVAWLAITQILASGLGGYLTGRLRVKWTHTPRDEVHFRDTAHGLLTWSVASLLVAAVMATGLGNITSKSIDVGASVVSGVAGATVADTAAAASDGESLSYYVDSILRPEGASPNNQPAANANEPREVAGILANSIKSGGLSTEDRNYLGMIISRHTGMNQTVANARVDAIYSRVSQAVADAKTTAQQAADSARKATAHTALWMVVALLGGAFGASLAALWGGKGRDHDHPMPVRKSFGPAS